MTWVWIKRGVGHGVGHDIPYGLPYDLSVVNFLKLCSALLQTYVNTSSVNLSYIRLSSVLLAAFRLNFRVWTKRGVGHGLGLCMLWSIHGPPYGLPVINSRLSIVVNLCKQHTP